MKRIRFSSNMIKWIMETVGLILMMIPVFIINPSNPGYCSPICLVVGLVVLIIGEALPPFSQGKPVVFFHGGTNVLGTVLKVHRNKCLVGIQVRVDDVFETCRVYVKFRDLIGG